MTEEQLQSKCYLWFHNEFVQERKMLFHVDNNSWNATIGARKKALGVVSGVSDFILILFIDVVFIEMKIPGGVQSEDQIKFQKMVEARGHKYQIIYSFEQFKDFIRSQLFKLENKYGKPLGDS